MGLIARDLRYALRQLRKAPLFAVVVVLMLALGIGANTAVFSVMNAVLMQLLPVAHPHGLYYVRMANGEGQPPGGRQHGRFGRLRSRNRYSKRCASAETFSRT